MKILFTFIFIIISSTSGWSAVFDCNVKYKINSTDMQHNLVIQYEKTKKWLTMPLYEVKEKNSLKFLGLGVDLVGSGLVNFDQNEEKLFITNYWSNSNDLRGFFNDPYDNTAIIAFNVKYADKKTKDKLLINLYMSKAFGEPFRTGFCKKL